MRDIMLVSGFICAVAGLVLAAWDTVKSWRRPGNVSSGHKKSPWPWRDHGDDHPKGQS